MIQGYPFPSSVLPGGELLLAVSTASKRFAADFFIQQERLRHLLTLEFPSVGFVDPGTAAVPWSWPTYPVSIPDAWPSGVYLVRLRALGVSGTPPGAAAATSAKMLFVVRSPTPASGILYKLPIASYHAYNATGGGSLYHRPTFRADTSSRVITLLRPGGGVGGVVPCCADVYRPETTRHTYPHWDAPFISWLARKGYHADFCTNLDVHARPDLLDGYALLIISAHDEYWSDAERNNVERFVARGGNVAIFGGNTCWWRVHYDEHLTTLACQKGDFNTACGDQWWSPRGAARPEESLTGVSYRNGGGWWEGFRQRLGYTVQDGKHWALEGTRLAAGDRFGYDTWPPLVGYECDGVPLTDVSATGRVTIHPEAHARGTPRGVEIVAAGRLNDRWQELPAREDGAAGQGIHAATLITYQAEGTVFNAATTDWVSVLTSGECGVVERITCNVFARLSRL